MDELWKIEEWKKRGKEEKKRATRIWQNNKQKKKK